LPIIVLPRSNSSLITLISNEFRANRNPLKKPHERVKSLSHGRLVGGRPPTPVWTILLRTTAGSVAGGVGGKAVAWEFETGLERPQKLKNPRL
jgi:hypothetical protein